MENFLQEAEHKLEEIASELKAEIVGGSATSAGNTTVTLAPQSTAVNVAEAATPTVVAATPIPRPEYAGKPKNNPAPQTRLANGNPRYAADGLTQDWFDTHPKK